MTWNCSVDMNLHFNIILVPKTQRWKRKLKKAIERKEKVVHLIYWKCLLLIRKAIFHGLFFLFNLSFYMSMSCQKWVVSNFSLIYIAISCHALSFSLVQSLKLNILINEFEKNAKRINTQIKLLLKIVKIALPSCL